jgi:hypothetical protein
MHRQTVNKGQVNYEPNTLATGAEQRVDGGTGGFQSYPERLESPKIRRRSASFDDHFSHATLFWNSQSQAEKEHIVAAFQFELSKVQVPAIRQRVVDNLAHVDAKLARKVAEPLGIGAPDAKAAAGRAGFREARFKLPIEASAALSMETAGGPIHTRKVAILVADGVETGAMKIVQQALVDAGAQCKVVGPHLGFVSTSSGQQLAVDFTYANMPSVMFDAVLVPAAPSAPRRWQAQATRSTSCWSVQALQDHLRDRRRRGTAAQPGHHRTESPAVAGVLVGQERADRAGAAGPGLRRRHRQAPALGRRQRGSPCRPELRAHCGHEPEAGPAAAARGHRRSRRHHDRHDWATSSSRSIACWTTCGCQASSAGHRADDRQGLGAPRAVGAGPCRAARRAVSRRRGMRTSATTSRSTASMPRSIRACCRVSTC